MTKKQKKSLRKNGITLPAGSLPLDKYHGLFGDLLVEPARLPFRARVVELRRLAAALQDGKPDPRAACWLGKAIQDWLQFGGDIAGNLGVRPPAGSTLTAQRLIAQEAQDRALVRFAGACGTDRKALAVLRGKEPCPPQAVALLPDVSGARTYNLAISRARQRLSLARVASDHV